MYCLKAMLRAKANVPLQLSLMYHSMEVKVHKQVSMTPCRD